MGYQIRKSDNYNTRRAKKSAKNNLKRIDKNYNPNKVHTSTNEVTRYDKDVELFF
jgi:hypothetical protein